MNGEKDDIVHVIWYKVIWRKWKKLAKRIANYQTDTDSSSDESVLDEKLKILLTSRNRLDEKLNILQTRRNRLDEKLKILLTSRNRLDEKLKILLTSRNRLDEKLNILQTRRNRSPNRKMSQSPQVLILQQPKSEYVYPLMPQAISQNQINLTSTSGDSADNQKLTSSGVAEPINLTSTSGDSADNQKLTSSGVAEPINLTSTSGDSADNQKLTSSGVAEPINLTSTSGDSADNQKLTSSGVAEPINLTSTSGDSADNQKLTSSGVAEPINLTSTSGDSADNQKLTSSGVAEPINLTSTSGDSADNQKLTSFLVAELINLTSTSGDSADNQKLTSLLVAELIRLCSINVIPEIGDSAYMQTLTRSGVAEPNIRVYYRQYRYAYFAQNGTNLKIVTYRNSEASILVCMEMLSMLSIDLHGSCIDSIYLNQERNGTDVLLSYLQIRIKKPDNSIFWQITYDITTSPGNTGEEPIEFENPNAVLRLLSDNYLIINLHLQNFLGCKDVIINGYQHKLTTTIKLYRNIIKNETCRVMISIDMVASKAIQLFGLEKTQIFFDFLDEKLFHFESPGIISKFVLDMAQYAVRKHVISFFENAGDIINNLMLLLLCFPDSKSLQKMTEKEFISLMQRVIDSSSLKTKCNKGAKPSLKVTKGIKCIMVDPEVFVRAMGGEISEDISNRHRHGDEMIVYSFIDTRHQPSDGTENRPVHAVYFPSDCRLFIYIPTENGSYWHQSDMQRAIRIHRQK